MAYYSTNDFKSGLKVMLDGNPCSIMENGQVGEVLQLQLHFKQELAQARYLWIKANHQLEQVLIQACAKRIFACFNCRSPRPFSRVACGKNIA